MGFLILAQSYNYFYLDHIMLDIQDTPRLRQYLLDRQLIARDESVTVSALSGGVSNKTLLVSRPKNRAFVIKQALSRLRVKKLWECDPARLQIEALALQWMSQHITSCKAPEYIFFDAQNHILVMEAITSPFANLKTQLLSGQPDKSIILKAAVVLAEIHNEGIHGREYGFENKSFFKTLRIEPYYLNTTSEIPSTNSFYKNLIDQTLDINHTLTHGDFSPKNMLIKDRDIILLDYEVMHFGDPAFDIGFFLTHLLSKANFLPSHRDSFIDASSFFWENYLSKVPYFQENENELRAVNHTLGCLLARIAGRSPLEYLDDHARQRQREVSLKMIIKKPGKIFELINEIERLLNSSS